MPPANKRPKKAISTRTDLWRRGHWGRLAKQEAVVGDSLKTMKHIRKIVERYKSLKARNPLYTQWIRRYAFTLERNISKFVDERRMAEREAGGEAYPGPTDPKWNAEYMEVLDRFAKYYKIPDELLKEIERVGREE